MTDIETMVANLGRIRDLYGMDKYRFAAAHAARMVLAQEPGREAEIREALKDIPDLDELLSGPGPSFPGVNLPPQDQMLEGIRASMPGIQTQAQLNVVLTAFDALRATLNATFLGQKEQAQRNRTALLQALDTAEKATELSVKLGQVPEAATSKAAEEFKNPPLEFQEYDVLKALLHELSQISSREILNQWYVDNRSRIDLVKSQSYRNMLLDGIRAKKKELAEASERSS